MCVKTINVTDVKKLIMKKYHYIMMDNYFALPIKIRTYFFENNFANMYKHIMSYNNEAPFSILLCLVLY